MNIDVVELRNNWLQDFCNDKEASREPFFGGLEGEFLARKNQIFSRENPDTLFFKYTSLNQNTLNSIKESSIYFRHPRDFNDPFDSRCYKADADLKTKISYQEASYIFELFCKETGWDKFSNAQRKILLDEADCRENLEKIVRRLSPTHLQKNIFERDHDLNKERLVMADERLLISCFSSINNHMLMWSHYANNHRGICIGYDHKKYEDLLHPVAYRQDFSANINEAKLVKHLEWRYEHEWRIVISENLHKLLDITNPKRITDKILGFECCKIYLGAKFKKNFEDAQTKAIAEELLEIAKARGIPVYQMNLGSSGFEFYEECANY